MPEDGRKLAHRVRVRAQRLYEPPVGLLRLLQAGNQRQHAVHQRIIVSICTFVPGSTQTEYLEEVDRGQDAVRVMRGEKRPQILRARAVACRSAFCVSTCTFVPAGRISASSGYRRASSGYRRAADMRPQKVGRARRAAAA
jgi:hypothetical protein